MAGVPDGANLLYLVDFVAERGLALRGRPTVEAKQLPGIKVTTLLTHQSVANLSAEPWARCSGPVLLAKTRAPETPADAAQEAQARLTVELPLLAAHQARLKTRLEP